MFINDVKTMPYFKLERETRKGDPISAYLFILALKMIFALINANPNIKDLRFFSHNFLNQTYNDDTTLITPNEKSAPELTINIFDVFFFWS